MPDWNGKFTWMKFHTGDWLKDPALSLCHSATRGVWIDLLCAMHESSREGILRGTAEQLARVARTSPAEIVQALTDLQTTGAADVTERNGVFTVKNRRMSREAKSRVSACERKRRQRSKTDVTPESQHGHGDVPPERPRDQETKTREVSLEPSVTAARKRLPAVPLPEIPEALDTPAFREAWANWLEHRRQKRDPVTSTAAVLSLKKLMEIGVVRSVAAIEHSVRSGWKGIFEENGAKHVAGRTTRVYRPTAVERGEHEQPHRELPTIAANHEPERSGGGTDPSRRL